MLLRIRVDPACPSTQRYMEEICSEAIRRSSLPHVKKEDANEDVKKAMDKPEEKLQATEQDVLGPVQAKMLRAFVAAADCRRLDPAVMKNAEEAWMHLIRRCDVSELRHTHNTVAETFLNGSFRGTRVSELTVKLRQGLTKLADIPPLVAVDFWGKLFVVCGNRRLRALRDYASETSSPTEVQVIVHRLPLDSIEDASLRCAFLAKAVLAATTMNGGRNAEIRRRPPQLHRVAVR